ncbi:polysaccharide deacetylase family protein [Oryzobacter terrae]|uniref:polysaccharide deacetylase family protein n=1 Tax=Oryzobacter terrae TaxID=1620385 RepID=UPI00366C4CA2
MPATRAAAATASAVGAVAAVGAVLWWQPRWLARQLSRQRSVVVHGTGGRREVALTLDDGPHPALTPQVLEVLAAHGAAATFFVLGARVAAHPELARAVAEAGHEVGNHGWDDTAAVLATRESFRRDLDRTQTTVLDATGAVPVLTRPGSGWVRPAQVRDAAGRGLATVLGSIAVRDATVRDVAAEVRFVLDRVQPGSVVVLHEGDPSRGRVVDLLARLLPALTARGYRLVTVSDLLAGQRSIS